MRHDQAYQPALQGLIWHVTQELVYHSPQLRGITRVPGSGNDRVAHFTGIGN